MCPELVADALVDVPETPDAPARHNLSTICVVCISILIFVFGAFRLAEILGIKHALQGVLLFPVALGAGVYIALRPRVLWNPLIVFAVVKLVTEIAYRANFLYISEGLAVIVAVTVLLCAPAASIRTGAKVIVWMAACLAAMSVIQWLALFVAPELDVHRLIISDDGQVLSSITHPISLLGLCTEPAWTLWGHAVGRCYSFVREPSLILVYFYIPAILALYINERSSRYTFGILLLFCVMSFAGCAWLSLAFGAAWWLLSRRLTVRFIYPYGMLMVAGLYIYFISTRGVDFLLSVFESLGQVSGLLARSASITDRALPAVANFKIALVSPFGSPTLSDASGPWLINTALAAGWIGVVLVIVFLVQAGRRLDQAYREAPEQSVNKMVTFLTCGMMTTVLVFNDYQMISYAGLILLVFLYRLSEPAGDPDELPEAEPQPASA